MKLRRRIGLFGLVFVLAGFPAWLYAQYRLHVGPLTEGQAFWFDWGATGFQLGTLAVVGAVLYLAVRQYTTCDPRDAEFMREVGPFIIGVIFAVPFWVIWVVYDLFVRPSGAIHNPVPYLIVGDEVEVNNHGNHFMISRADYILSVIVKDIFTVGMLCAAASTLVIYCLSGPPQQSTPSSPSSRQ